jgi:Fe-coproporphyrin III synthase
MSGGEPLLYKGLSTVLEQAHRCGMLTTVTTNGMLLDDRRLLPLLGVLDLLAISLDGVPESHNRMRNSDRAFVAMQERLEGVRQSGIPFGFIFTLTQHNIHELEWVADFALDQGAKLLQIHPLEEVGRAEQQLSGSGPDSVESAYTYLEVLRIQAQVGDKLYLQLDLANQNAFRAEPARAYAGHPVSNVEVTGLADLTSPLVIEADGTVVPLQYGFARRYALGSLLQSSLSELALIWRR